MDINNNSSDVKGSIDSIIDTAIKNIHVDDPVIKEVLKSRMRDRINKEIKDYILPVVIENEKIKWEKENKVNVAEENKKHINMLVLETICIGFFLGLLVNQFTDVLSHSKGVEGINLPLTWTYIVILIVLIIVLVWFLWFKTVSKVRKK